jgi:tRNA(Ile)-lysidine synthase
MSDLHLVEQRIATAWPPVAWHDMHVLLAVSGGADSVAMLHALVRLKTEGDGRLELAHFNHHLRGKESDADEAFVVKLAAQLGVPCHVGHASEQLWSGDRHGSIEATARTARYDFFRRTAEQLGARYLVTAHTADDQAETILHRIIRGTGISGLAGINRVRVLGPAVTVIRPMLAVRRTELLAYLGHLGQSFRTDSSNQDPRYTRNRIRHQLLPRLATDFNPSVIEALVRLGALAVEVQTVVDTLVEDLAECCVEHISPGVVRVDVTQVAQQPRYVVRELMIGVWRQQGWPLQAMGFVEWDQLADMVYRLPAKPGEHPHRRIFPGNLWATLREGELRLEKR